MLDNSMKALVTGASASWGRSGGDAMDVGPVGGATSHGPSRGRVTGVSGRDMACGRAVSGGVNTISIPFGGQATSPAPILARDKCGWIMPGCRCTVIGHEYPVTVLRKSILPEFVYVQEFPCGPPVRVRVTLIEPITSLIS